MEENQVQIPKRWKSKKLGSVCKIKKGVQFNKIELSAFGMYPCINGGIEPSGYSDLWNTNENTITISEGGNSCGYVNLVKTKFWSGGHCYSLLDLGNELDNDFLYQALKGRQHLIMDLRVGSGLPNIQQKAIKEFEFLIPDDKPEQIQIASILSKVDNVIAQTEQLIAKYTRIKTGLMRDLLTRGIDEHGNIRSEATHEFKDSPLGRIPKEWEVKKMGDLVLAIDPQPDHRTPAAIENGIPYVGISDILDNGEIDLKSCRKVGLNVLEKQQGAFKVAEGDIIFGKIGTIGKPKVLPSFSNFQFTLSANIILIKPHECPDFIYWSLVSKYVEDQVNLAIHSTSQPAFGMQKIRDLNILTPLPEERNRITEKLRKLNMVVSSENSQLSKLQSLKTGLMQDLLSGKVRVNQLIKETMKA